MKNIQSGKTSPNLVTLSAAHPEKSKNEKENALMHAGRKISDMARVPPSIITKN
jgi:hypothetical protein